MTDFINHSAFPALCFQSMDQNDIEFHVVAAKISYDIIFGNKNTSSSLGIALKQDALHYTDVYYNSPGSHSVEYECDLSPYKPKTDVVINATAFSPGGKAVPSFEVAVKIGTFIKTLRIYGPRYWQSTLGKWLLEPPQPIDSLAVRYEYASGGQYEVKGKMISSATNPSGLGWYPAEYLRDCNVTRLPAPQIEAPNTAVNNIKQIVTPQGFGFFGRGWQGRIEYAGTYDKAWIKERHPYLPDNFNFNYWCGSHPSLQITHPKPGEIIPIMLYGLLPVHESPAQQLAFHLPVETLFIFFSSRLGISVTKDMTLDTIVIDLHKRKVFCTYRTVLEKALDVSEIQLRYIAAADRQRYRHQAAVMLKDTSSSAFIPVPPGLMTRKVTSHG